MTYLINPYRFAGGGISSPEDVSGLFLWFDATDTSYLWQDDSQTTAVSSDTDPVGTWRNKATAGGSENFTSSGTARPLYSTNTQNGLAVIEYDGSDDKLTYTGEITKLESSFTFFGVGSLAAGVTNDWGPTLATNGSGTGTFLHMMDTRSSPKRLCAYYSGSQSFLDRLSEASPGAELLSVTHNNNTLIEGFLNGTSQGSSATVTAAASSSNQLGAYGTGKYLNGWIGEVLVYDTVLSTADRQSVETYLMNRWGIS